MADEGDGDRSGKDGGSGTRKRRALRVTVPSMNMACVTYFFFFYTLDYGSQVYRALNR